MDERNYAMFVYGKNAEYAFNKYGQEQLEDAFLGYFGDNDWYGGASHYLDTCDEYLTLAEEEIPWKNTLPLYLIVVAASLRDLRLYSCIMLGRGRCRRSIRRWRPTSMSSPRAD